MNNRLAVRGALVRAMAAVSAGGARPVGGAETPVGAELQAAERPHLQAVTDEEKKAAFSEQLGAEHDDYEQYLEMLSKSLEEILSSGGATLIWKMN